MDQKWPPDQEFETPDLVGVNSKLDHIKSIKNSEIKLREFVYIINVCLFMKCPFLRGTRECLWGQRKKKTVKQLWTFQLLQTVRNEAETKEEAYTVCISAGGGMESCLKPEPRVILLWIRDEERTGTLALRVKPPGIIYPALTKTDGSET